MNKIKQAFTVLGILCCFLGFSQNKNKTKTAPKPYPAAFSISKSDFQKIMDGTINNRLSFNNNPYINQSTVQLNTLNGDMHFVKIQLSYFAKSYLLVQQNGSQSTIVFIMSDDKSVFYKGKMDPDQLTMRKCAEDDIVSE